MSDLWMVAFALVFQKFSSMLVLDRVSYSSTSFAFFQCKCIDPASKSASTCADPKYKGDGNCDDANNNAGCAYDGGDCCAKTVAGGVVKTSYCKEVGCFVWRYYSFFK